MPLLSNLLALALAVQVSVPSPDPAPPPPPVIERGTVAVRLPAPPAGRRIAPEAPFAEALGDALTNAGFTTIPGVNNARYVTSFEVKRIARGAVRARGGAGSASGATGVLGNALGGGVSVPLGSSSSVGELVETELEVSLTRRGEDAPVWTGRAITHAVAGTRDDEPGRVAAKLSAALFRNFPQASGLTISVP